jgi:hypothetical protein
MDRAEHMMRVRLPAGLHQELVEAARSNNRSVNAEILSRLALPTSKVRGGEEYTFDQLMRKIEDQHVSLEFYRKNIGLYAAAAQFLAYVVETAKDIIADPETKLPKPLDRMWEMIEKSAAPMLATVKKFEIPDPADRSAMAVGGAEAVAAREANQRIKEMVRAERSKTGKLDPDI